jgi:hypothetical protein
MGEKRGLEAWVRAEDRSVEDRSGGRTCGSGFNTPVYAEGKACPSSACEGAGVIKRGDRYCWRSEVSHATNLLLSREPLLILRLIGLLLHRVASRGSCTHL